MKALRKPLSLFMAMLMCLGIFAGTGTTAFAATEDVGTIMFCGRCLTKKAQNRSSIGMFSSREISLATDTFGQRRPDS